jgi:hypothetical protein
MKKRAPLLFLLAALLSFQACTNQSRVGKGRGAAAVVGTSPEKTMSLPVEPDTGASNAPSCNISATPTNVSWGNQTTLQWTSNRATSASLNHNIGAVAIAGSKPVLTLVNGTTYTLTVSGGGKSASCSTTIGVSNIPPPLTSVVDASSLGLPPLNYVKGPIIIDGQHGVTISGQAIYNHDGPCMIIRNSSNIHITRNQFFECGKAYGAPDGVVLMVNNSSYVTIDYNYFSDSGPNSQGIIGNDNSHLNIDHNHFYHVAGGIGLWRGTAQNVTYNRFQNMIPRAGSLSGFVQFVQAYGGLNTIACNTGSNDPAVVPQSGDLINIYMSNGVPHSPIQVYGNKLLGQGVNLGGAGLASAGIQTGDGSFSSNIRVFYNQIVNFNSGIQVTGGEAIEVFSNRIYAGGRSGFYTSGFGAVNFYGVPGQVWTKPGAYCRNIHIHDNAIAMAADSFSRAFVTDFNSINGWPNCEIVMTSNNDVAAVLDASIVNALPAPGCGMP